METIKLELKRFQEISKGLDQITTEQIIENIQKGIDYLVVSSNGDFTVILYKDADGKETLGLNAL